VILGIHVETWQVTTEVRQNMLEFTHFRVTDSVPDKSVPKIHQCANALAYYYNQPFSVLEAHWNLDYTSNTAVPTTSITTSQLVLQR